MRLKRLVGIVLGIACVVLLANGSLHADAPNQREREREQEQRVAPLRGLSGIRIEVRPFQLAEETLFSVEKGIWTTRAERQVQERIEQRLREAGIRVLHAPEANQVPADALLRISIVRQADQNIRYGFELMPPMPLRREPSISLPAPAWRYNVLGLEARLVNPKSRTSVAAPPLGHYYIGGTIDRQLDRFIGDYRMANPKNKS